METTKVIHIASGKETEVYILRNFKDYDQAYKENLFHSFSVEGITKYLNEGKAVSINMSGGYCPFDDAYKIIEPEIDHTHTGTYENDMVTVRELIHNVDFDKLKNQLKALYAAQTALTAIGGKENIDIVQELDGIVHYFDKMRDIAVDVYDYEEEKVFDLSEEEE